MYNEDISWINQELYFFKDKTYNTNSILEATISSSTSNNQNFTPPTLLLSIKDNNNQRRTCTLSYSNICDILKGSKEVTSNIELAYQKNYSIDRRYNNNRNLKIQFKKSNQTNENCVVFGIFYNDSDFSMIILSLIDYLNFMELVQNFKDNFIQISLSIPQKYLMSILISNTKEISTGIKILPSQIEIPIVDSTGEATSSPEVSMKPSTTSSIEDLDKFIDNEAVQDDNNDDGITSEFDTFSDENINDVKINEIENLEIDAETKETEKRKEVVIESPFINEVLKNNIANFEHTINNVYHCENPLTSMQLQLCDSNTLVENILPGITDEDVKSACYVSKMLFKTFFINYLENNIPIPASCPVIRYEPKDEKPENVELAYDLLMITSYIKCLRNKLESKNSDSESNKAILNIASRCFVDIFIFSFLHNKNPDSIKSCVLSRFRSNHSNGFFNDYEDLTKNNNCSVIREQDLSEFLDIICGKIIGKATTIKELHDELYENENIKIGYDNKYDLEQITNEIVLLELATNFKKDISGITENEEILALFTGEQKKKKPTKKREPTKGNLERFINEVDFIKQIPSDKKEAFLKLISELTDDYDFTNEEFPLEEFGDDIIKALYVWNESENKSERYTDFRVKLENCLDRDLIISKVKITEELTDNTGSEGGDWIGNLSDLM